MTAQQWFNVFPDYSYCFFNSPVTSRNNVRARSHSDISEDYLLAWVEAHIIYCTFMSVMISNLIHMTVCSLAQMDLDLTGSLLKDHNFLLHSLNNNSVNVVSFVSYNLWTFSKFSPLIRFHDMTSAFGWCGWGSPDRMLVLLFHSCRNIILSHDSVGRKASYNSGNPYFIKWILTSLQIIRSKPVL